MINRIIKINFFTRLQEELTNEAWSPDRTNYLDWCLDFEELRDLKQRWSN